MNDQHCKQCHLSHPYLRVLQSAYVYHEDNALQRIIHAVKFGGDAAALEVVTASVDLPVVSHISRGDVVLVPIPLHRSRMRERGYNQAEILTKHLAKQTGYTVGNILYRTKKTQAQATLGAVERHKNIEGAFSAIRVVDAKKRYMLVDDVLTTGSTLSSAAKVLYDAGASWVGAWVLARAQRDTL